MKNRNVSEIFGKVWELIKKNKFVMIVLVVGLVLILLPIGGAPAAKKDAGDLSQASSVEFSLSETENRIAGALSRIEGAGKVTVLLTLKCGTEQVIARDESESSATNGKGDGAETSSEHSSTTVIVSSGSSVETPVTLKYIYPEYLGALVVAEGADDAAVKLQLTRAVSGLTGLGADKIVVTKMNKSS
jgi:stage III sporulation protein AG